MNGVYDKKHGDVEDDSAHVSNDEIAKLENYANEQGKYDREFGNIGKNEGLYNPKDGVEDNKKAVGKDELEGKEKKTADADGGKETVRGNLNKLAADSGDGGPGRFKQLAKNLVAKKNRKKLGIIAASGGGIAGLITAGVLFLGPLKVLSVMTNLQNEFFAASDDAADRMGSQMFNHYIIRKVIPGMSANNGCNSTKTDRSCAAVGDNTTPLAALFIAWRDNNLEGKLANNHGIEIRKEAGGRYFLRAPGLNEPLDLGTYNGNSQTFDGNAYAQMSRSEVRRAIRAGFEAESYSKRVRYHFSVGKLMERKYGIRRCVLACDTRDRISDNIDARRNSFKLRLVERYVIPRSEVMGLAINCALSDFNCAEPGEPNADGDRESEFRRTMRESLAQYRATHGDRPIDELQRETDRVRQYGVTGYMVRRIAGDTIGGVTDKIFGKFVPIVGWLDGLASIYQSAQNVGPAVKHINYAMNSAGAVALAGMMFTAADEAKTGQLDAAELGAFTAALGEVPGGNQGGGAMESTPVYDYMNNGTGAQTASVWDYFSPKTYAAQAEPEVTGYTCDKGGAVPAGELVCPEMGVGATSTAGQIAAEISRVANNPALSPVNVFAEVWDSTFGAIFDWVTGIIGDLVEGLADAVVPEWLIERTVAWVQDNIMKPFFIEQIGNNPSGGRIFEVLGFGVNQMGNDDAQFNQGGKVLTPEESAQIAAARYDERQAEFASKPLYARMFDTNDTRSMVSRVALAMPSGSIGFSQRISSFASDPFGGIARSFSSIFATPKANAYRPVTSPYGLETYGYPVNHEVFTPGLDVEKYWEDNDCDNPELVKNWGAKATELDPDTNVPLQRENEPCMLIRSVVASSGGAFDKDLLLPDPATSAGGDGGGAGGTTPPPATGGTAIPAGDSIALANQILNNPNISFQTGARATEFRRIAASGRGTACGNPVINPKLLGTILKLAESYKIVLGVFVEGRGSCGGQHSAGNAVDINGVNPLDGGTGTGNRIGDPPPSGASDPFPAQEQPILKSFWGLAGQVLSANGGGALGQYQCFSNPAPARSGGVVYFANDTCDHIHLDVR